MRRSLTLMVASLLAWAGCDPARAQAGGPDRPERGVKLLYCREGTAASAWERSGLLAIARVAGLSGDGVRISALQRTCGPEMPDATCFAIPDALACRAPALERALRAAAFLLARWFVEGGTEYEDFHTRHDRAVVTAFQQADGAPAEERLRDLVERMRAADGTPDARRLSEQDAVLAHLFRGIADRVLTVIVAHELSHVGGDVCALGRASVAEESGAWAEAVQSHREAALFCSRPLAPAELVADRCALRFLRAIDERADANASSRYASTLRRLAADAVAYVGYFGFRAQPPQGALTPARLTGYLHEPFRGLLFAAEVNGGRARPAVCGTAARIFVQATQATYKGCTGKGIVGDVLLGRLPVGVEKSWNGEPWTQKSWSCLPE